MPDSLSFELGSLASVPPGLVRQARVDAESVGYLNGWTQGLREANSARAADLAAARAEHARFIADRDQRLRAAMAALADATARLEQAHVPAARDIEDDIVGYAVELAEALLGRELRDVDATARDALARAMRLAPDGEPVTVSVSPQDYAVLVEDEPAGDDGDSDAADAGVDGPSTVAAAILREISEAAGHQITLTRDPALSPGDSLARYGATTIDARLSEGIRRVKEALAR